MFVKLDFEDIKQFEERLRVISKDLQNRFFREAVSRIGGETLREVVERSPVGKGTPNPGQLRRSWGLESVKRNGDTWYVKVINPAEYNNEPYPLYVEEGHRLMRNKKQIGFVEGKHMLRDSLEEKIAPQTQEYLEGKLKELFGV